MAEHYEMGNLIKLREEIDQHQRVTNHIRSHLAVIDLIPVNYQLQLANMQKQWGIQYDFDSALKQYRKVLSTYNLPGKDMLRLWLTDDTVVSDNFSNNFNPNIIEQHVNSLEGMSNTIKTMRQLSQSVSNKIVPEVGKHITETVNTGLDWGQQLLFPESKLAEALTKQAQAVTSTVGEVIFQGKQISLPKIWTSSTYSPTLTVTVKLVSPYGSPEAVKEFIITPLMYLLALISPKTRDGLSYGLAQPLYVIGHGITNMSLAAVQNVTMRRGGRETSFNIHKQPLILDIMITIQPLADGFASVDGNNDIATIDDAANKVTVGRNTSGPAITTLGNIIQSLRPAPDDVVTKGVIEEQTHHKNAPPGKLTSGAGLAINTATQQQTSEFDFNTAGNTGELIG